MTLSDFHFVGVSGPLQSVCGPWDVLAFRKHMYNSFQISISKVYFFAKCTWLTHLLSFTSSLFVTIIINTNWYFIQSDSRFYGPIYLGKNCELSKWIQVVTPPLLANFHSPPPAKRTNSYSKTLWKELFLETLNNYILCNMFSFLVSLTYF